MQAVETSFFGQMGKLVRQMVGYAGEVKTHRGLQLLHEVRVKFAGRPQINNEHRGVFFARPGTSDERHE